MGLLEDQRRKPCFIIVVLYTSLSTNTGSTPNLLRPISIHPSTIYTCIYIYIERERCHELATSLTCQYVLINSLFERSLLFTQPFSRYWRTMISTTSQLEPVTSSCCLRPDDSQNMSRPPSKKRPAKETTSGILFFAGRV